MITSIKDLTKELEKLSYSIEQVLKQSSYSEYDDLSGLECDLTDPNELMLREEYRSILDHLDQANYTINYLSRPIKTEGYLRYYVSKKRGLINGKTKLQTNIRN